jgi:hypothetical protein
MCTKMSLKIFVIIFLLKSTEATMNVKRLNSTTTVNEQFVGLKQTFSDDRKIVQNYFTLKRDFPAMEVGF